MEMRKTSLALKAFAIVIVLTALFSFSMFARPAFAQSADQAAQLQSLLQMVAALQQQLALLQAGGNSGGISTTPGGVGRCPTFYRTLGVGTSGSDVSELQQFLTSTGDYTYGSITGYFGAVTEEAVKRFQCRQGIICEGSAGSTGYGSVGPATQSQISRMCGGTYVQPTSPYIYNPVIPSSPVTCSVGSVSLRSGESRTFFLNSLAPVGTSCQSELRTCQFNGIASGNPAYSASTCSVENIQCSVGSTVLQVGQSRTFYKNSSAPYGSSCQSAVRICQSNGVVTGDTAYSAANCTADTTPDDCTIPASGSVATSSVSHGIGYKFYSASTVSAGQSCDSISQTRMCNNGVFSGSSVYSHSSCTVAQSCTVGGVTLRHNESRVFYSASTVTQASGQQCSSIGQLRTCNNGVLSGSNTYSSPNCDVSRHCTENGIDVLHGTSREFFNVKKVLYGQDCNNFKQVRTCTNNVLSGSSAYEYGACKVGEPKDCPAIDGKTVEHGSGHTFYSVESVNYNQSCDAYAQNRTCADGVLSGIDRFKFASCTQEKEENCMLDGLVFAPGKHKVYSQRTVSSGQKCSSVAQTRTCKDGRWTTGDAKYDKARCAPEGKKWCKQDGDYVKHGKSGTFYAEKSVAYGRICFGILRSCDNGTLKGSQTYQYSSCRVVEPRSCELNGKTIKHGQVGTFWSAKVGSVEEPCAQLQGLRTCNDGALGGATKFQYTKCEDVADADEPL
ncbi:peptidoglycan-binding protein [Candidatus Parcubacteria bacterium]|nr:MAG: peptidoglycan-binding protein [Candidatus Parcubacteria bacterium]